MARNDSDIYSDIDLRILISMSASASGAGLSDADVCAVIVVAAIEAAPGPDGFRRAWFGWIGDVSVWRRAERRWEHLLGDAKGGGDGLRSSEVGTVLPMDWARGHQELLRVGPGDTLALVTDGVGDLWSAHERANDYFCQRWSEPPPAPSFLNDVCFDARGEQDDRTAVVVWTPSGGCGD
ncbi:protein phosphatase 2C domain-containing protein [Actinoplanes sp. NPDC051633]|uniref:protein phosphatase 2C domain-containing protein n=1 Tax=Actinoplanes sp. NPDC051633 TaxID=3155670 RepID=UPI0034197792